MPSCTCITDRRIQLPLSFISTYSCAALTKCTTTCHVPGRMSKTVFCGNLPLDIRHREVEDLFHKYGRVVDVDLKLPSRPPGFAFVEFADSRDASDAVRGRDGYDFAGAKLRVWPQ